MKTGALMRWKVHRHCMRAARVKTLAALALLVCASLAGCLSTVDEGDDENGLGTEKQFEQYESLAKVIIYLIDTDRHVKATTNNPNSSRSHSLIFVNLNQVNNYI